MCSDDFHRYHALGIMSGFVFVLLIGTAGRRFAPIRNVDWHNSFNEGYNINKNDNTIGFRFYDGVDKNDDGDLGTEEGWNEERDWHLQIENGQESLDEWEKTRNVEKGGVDDDAILQDDDGILHKDRDLSASESSLKTIRFFATQNAPYGNRERTERFGPQWHRAIASRADFVIHLGSVRERQQLGCNTNTFVQTFGQAAQRMLESSPVPVFVIPGDGDWYTCIEQSDAWRGWSNHFLRFYNNWNHGLSVRHQENRPENFSFFHKNVLFVSFHILSSTVRDWDEWNVIVKDDVMWLETQLVSNHDRVMAIVLMAHAQPHSRRYREFYDSLRQIAMGIDTPPMLFLHGDGRNDEFEIFHYESNDEVENDNIVARDGGLTVQNMIRVSVGAGGKEDPLEIIVDPYGPIPFSFKRHVLVV